MTFDQPCVGKRSRLTSVAGAALLVLATAGLGGCQTTSSVDTIMTGSTQPASLKGTAEAAKRWEADPGNVKHGLHYAGLLKGIGQTDKALSVIGELVTRNPANGNLLTIYGKELAQAGRAEQASQVLQRVTAGGTADWKIYSALGSAYDQQGRFKEAREAYQTALKVRPGEVSVLNNMAMSYALEGNLAEAEKVLREAAAQPRGAREPRIRQNLALVVGLQGRFDEAKQIAGKDLPPVQVEANMTYLRTMLSQPDPWQQLRQPASGNKG
jgi:Flp pilus assembly protein TadD